MRNTLKLMVTVAALALAPTIASADWQYGNQKANSDWNKSGGYGGGGTVPKPSDHVPGSHVPGSAGWPQKPSNQTSDFPCHSCKPSNDKWPSKPNTGGSNKTSEWPSKPNTGGGSERPESGPWTRPEHRPHDASERYPERRPHDDSERYPEHRPHDAYGDRGSLLGKIEDKIEDKIGKVLLGDHDRGGYGGGRHGY
jgi:hypothetical protein